MVGLSVFEGGAGAVGFGQGAVVVGCVTAVWLGKGSLWFAPPARISYLPFHSTPYLTHMPQSNLLMCPASEMALLEMMLQSPHRTLDPEEADFFFVPSFSACYFNPVFGELLCLVRGALRVRCPLPSCAAGHDSCSWSAAAGCW